MQEHPEFTRVDVVPEGGEFIRILSTKFKLNANLNASAVKCSYGYYGYERRQSENIRYFLFYKLYLGT